MHKIAILSDMPIDALTDGAKGRGSGQAATWLSQLANAYSSASEFQFYWLILDKKVQQVTVSQYLNQLFYRIPKGIMTLDILLGHVFAQKKLRNILKKIQPDLIHVWGTEGSYASVIKEAGCPVILSMQGILSEYNRIGSFKSNWRMRRQARYEKEWIKQSTLVTTESEWGRGKVNLIRPDAPWSLVEYGVNPSFYDVPWNPKPESPTLLYCGGDDWRKGFDILVEALRIQPVPAWKCWIAGGGITPEVAQRLPSNVEVLGNLSWRDLQERMSRAWGLVLPTRSDTSPNAVKEARVIGLPVITSRHGGQSGYIKHRENGLIVDPLTPQDLRIKMDSLATNYSTCRSMGLTHHQTDRDYFQPERTAEGFMSLYRVLAGDLKK